MKNKNLVFVLLGLLFFTQFSFARDIINKNSNLYIDTKLIAPNTGKRLLRLCYAENNLGKTSCDSNQPIRVLGRTQGYTDSELSHLIAKLSELPTQREAKINLVAGTTVYTSLGAGFGCALSVLFTGWGAPLTCGPMATVVGGAAGTLAAVILNHTDTRLLEDKNLASFRIGAAADAEGKLRDSEVQMSEAEFLELADQINMDLLEYDSLLDSISKDSI